MTVELWPPGTPGTIADPKHFAWYPGIGRWGGFMTPEVAKSLPGIARGTALITGQAMQMPLDLMDGVTPIEPRPMLLEQPDPDESRAWFVGAHWMDYLINGNALHLITSRFPNNDLPATCAWLPAAWCSITRDPVTHEVAYWVGGTRLNRDDVVHVKRGADPMNPGRGVGVVEQHLDALGVVRDQHRYEAEILDGAAVPSVAVIAPNPRLGKDEAEEAKEAWVEKFGGPKREPAILPAGSQVIPLAWSPSDAQLVEARQLSLTDQANMLNLDGYWLGAPSSGLTYKSPGPMYLNLLRQTIGPIAEVFEDVWSSAWAIRGRRVRHRRSAVLADDMPTMVKTAREGVEAGLWTPEEARVYMGMTPTPTLGTLRTPVPASGPTANPDDNQLDPDTEE